ncbi:MAG: hypothetical protein LBS60_07305 [Deltaproteobacteria bacterium]|nr:hypothetical protein [Deltaproteobacteria bacterium]
MSKLADVFNDPYIDSDEFNNMSPLGQRMYLEALGSSGMHPDVEKEMRKFSEKLHEYNSRPEVIARHKEGKARANRQMELLRASQRESLENIKKILGDDFDPDRWKDCML